MKNKLVIVMIVAVMALPCFSEIQCDRAGIKRNGVQYNLARYFNDKNIEFSWSSKDVVEDYAKIRTGGVEDRTVSVTEHIYYVSAEEIYSIQFYEGVKNCAIYIMLWGENGYIRDISTNENDAYYKSKYQAKPRFDSLCSEYYNKIPK